MKSVSPKNEKQRLLLGIKIRPCAFRYKYNTCCAVYRFSSDQRLLLVQLLTSCGCFLCCLGCLIASSKSNKELFHSCSNSIYKYRFFTKGLYYNSLTT